jgi:hypothetical protein
MSEQISEAAWKRAVTECLGFEWLGTIHADFRYYCGGTGKVTRAKALAAQAELDAANEVTDAERDDLYFTALKKMRKFSAEEQTDAYIVREVVDFVLAAKKARGAC